MTFGAAVPFRMGWLLPLALLLPASDRCLSTMRKPSPGAHEALRDALANGNVVSLGGEVSVRLVTIVWPDSVDGPPSIHTQPTDPRGFPPSALLPPSFKVVLENPGLYLALTNSNYDVSFVASIGDPRLVLNEWVDPATGQLTGSIERVNGGAAALRFPCVRGARLALFEVSGNGSVHIQGELELSREKSPGKNGGHVKPAKGYR